MRCLAEKKPAKTYSLYVMSWNINDQFSLYTPSKNYNYWLSGYLHVHCSIQQLLIRSRTDIYIYTWILFIIFIMIVLCTCTFDSVPVKKLKSQTNIIYFWYFQSCIVYCISSICQRRWSQHSRMFHKSFIRWQWGLNYCIFLAWYLKKIFTKREPILCWRESALLISIKQEVQIFSP